MLLAMVTCAAAPGLGAARDALGADHVVVAGDGLVDLAGAVMALRGRALSHLLCEGGPSLLGALLAAGLVDELCTTVVPLAVGGDHHRIVHAPELQVPLDLRLLAEDDGTLFVRWLVRRTV